MFRKALSSSVHRVNAVRQSARFSSVESPTGKDKQLHALVGNNSFNNLACYLSSVLYTWGDGSDGQLGHAVYKTTVNNHIPVCHGAVSDQNTPTFDPRTELWDLVTSKKNQESF